MKKLLSTKLRERTDTVEFRKIRRQLMQFADDKKYEFRILRLQQGTINMLQNEGIKVTAIKEHGCDKLLLSW